MTDLPLPDNILPDDFKEEITRQTTEEVERELWTDVHTVRLGQIINGVKTVPVPSDEALYKAEVYFTELDGSGAGRCINTKTSHTYGIKVEIGHPPNDKDRWKVLDIDIESEYNPVTQQVGVAPHSEDHSLRNVGYDGADTTGRVGVDPVLVDDRQFWQANIFPYSGLQARITPGWVMFNGQFKYYEGAILADQTANVPATAGRGAYVLVELDSDLTLTYTKGTEFVWTAPGAGGLSQYVPTGDDNTYKWVLLLRNGDTTLNYAFIWTGIHMRQTTAPQITSIAANSNTSGPGIYEVDTSGGAITLTVDSDDIAAAGRTFIVVDKTGDAETNNITIATEGAETIDGSPTLTIDLDYGSVQLYADGSNLTTQGGGAVGVDTFEDLTDTNVISPENDEVPAYNSSNSKWENKKLFYEVDDAFTIFIEQNQRNLDENVHGGLFSLSTADSVSSGVPYNVSAGIGKLFLVVNAGADTDGTITVTGTSVNRNTGVETPADTSTLTIDGLSTDNSDTDAQGNTRHDFENAYITDKWFTGTVTISTADVNLSDVDTYQCSFEQFNDQSDVTLKTFDFSGFVTNASAWFYGYLYLLAINNGILTLSRVSSLELATASVTANKAYRLRQGNIFQSLDGSTDGIFVELFFGRNLQTDWEDVTIKIWYSVLKNLLVTPDVLRDSDGMVLRDSDGEILEGDL